MKMWIDKIQQMFNKNKSQKKAFLTEDFLRRNYRLLKQNSLQYKQKYILRIVNN